jgi:hypothetical protein
MLAWNGCGSAPDEEAGGEGLWDGVDEAQDEQGQDKDIAPDGKGMGVFQEAGLPASNGGSGISYHGGAVMAGTWNRFYYIWYGNWAGNSATEILTDFAGNLSESPWWNINSTYTDSEGAPVSSMLTFGGSTTDAYSRGRYLTDDEVRDVVGSALVHRKLPTDPDGIYLVLTSADVTATSGFCSQYCGWHTYAKMNGTSIKYSFIGNGARCPSTCSAQKTTPNGNLGADAMVSIIAHELAEAATDPHLNAWFDSSGYENADKCAWSFGSMYRVSNGAKANVKLGDRHYLIQQNWVNAGAGYCATGF